MWLPRQETIQRKSRREQKEAQEKQVEPTPTRSTWGTGASRIVPVPQNFPICYGLPDEEVQYLYFLVKAAVSGKNGSLAP